MRIAFGLIVGAFLLISSGAFSQDCASSFNTLTLHCDGPHGCSGQVTLYIPIGDPYGFGVGVTSTSCCGQLFSTYQATGLCEDGIINKPGVKEQISLISTTSDLLIADCKGRYVLYDSSAGRVERRQSFLADDRVLR